MDYLSSFQSFGHDDAHSHYQDIYNTQGGQPHHHASLGHEAIAGAAGFAAMKAYESHLAASGQQPSHALMKEILAGIAAAEVDKLVETKGLDYIDRHKAKKLAEQQAHALAEERYGGRTGYEYVQSQGEEWGRHGHPSYAPLPTGYYPPPQGYQPEYQQGYGGYQEGYGGEYEGRHHEGRHHEGHHHEEHRHDHHHRRDSD